MAARVRDMTHGSPGRHIVVFALPLMLGNIFQQLYTMTDAIIVGRFAGVEALAAVGATDWLSWLLFGVISGFAQGFSILTAQRFGARDEAGLRRAVGNSATLAALIAGAFTLISLLSVGWTLRLLRTPENVFAMAALYLAIIYAGMPVTMTYNLTAGVLRSLGNSRAPLIAMVCASAANIALDLLFVAWLQWGVAGAAAATVLAQGLAAGVCLLALRRIPEIRLRRQDLALDRAVAKELMQLGAPVAAQNAIIAAGGMAVQRVVNEFGFVFLAGFTATNKLYGVLEVAATSFGFSMATFSGQNLGAGRLDRIRRGTNAALGISLITSCAISAAMFLFGRPILGLFVSATEAAADAVLDVAVRYLNCMAAVLFVLYFLYVYRSALQGMGDTLIPMLSGFVEMVMRVGTAFLLPRFIGQDGIYYAEIAAWIGATVLLGAGYYARIGRLERQRDGRDGSFVPPDDKQRPEQF